MEILLLYAPRTLNVSAHWLFLSDLPEANPESCEKAARMRFLKNVLSICEKELCLSFQRSQFQQEKIGKRPSPYNTPILND